MSIYARDHIRRSAMFGKIGRRWFAWLSVMIWNTVYQGTRFRGEFWSTGLGSCLIEDASSFIRDAAPFSSGVALTGNTSVVVRRVVLPCQQMGLMDFYPNSPLGVVPLTVPSCDSWGSPELLFQLGLSRLGESWRRLCKRLMEFFKLPGLLSSMHSSWFSCKCASNCYPSSTDNCTPSFTSKVTTCLKTLGSDWERKFFFSLFYIYA